MKLLKIIFILLFLVSCKSEMNSKKSTEENKPQVNKKESKYGGTLYLDTTPCRSLNFLDGDTVNVNDIIFQIADSLVSQDNMLNYQPRLAEKWDLLSNTEILFHLRKNVKWHDGYTFSADDVIYTYFASLTADFPWGDYTSAFTDVKSVEKLDNFTIKVTYKYDVYDLVSAFVDFFILPKHIYDTKKYTLINNPANFNPIGTGPFKFEKWEKNSQIVLTANEDYFNGRPFVDKLVFKVLEPSAMTYNMLLNNELDIVSLSPVDWKFKTNTDQFISKFYKLRYYTLGVFYLGWNCEQKWFKNKKIRKAMTYCVDLNEFNNNVKFGLYKPAATPLHLDVRYCAKDLKIYAFNLEKATQLLEESGFKKNANGLLVDKNGKQFEFEVIISSLSKSFESLLEYMQSNLQKIGVKMSIKLLEDSIYSEKLRNHDFDAFLGGIGTSDDPIFLDYVFSKKAIKNGVNYMQYINDDVEKLFSALEKEINPNKREEYFMKIQRILHEDQPWLILYYPPSLLGVNKRVKDLIPSPLGLMQWYPGLKNVYLAE